MGGNDKLLLLRPPVCRRTPRVKKLKDAAEAHFQYIGFISQQLKLGI